MRETITLNTQAVLDHCPMFEPARSLWLRMLITADEDGVVRRPIQKDDGALESLIKWGDVARTDEGHHRLVNYAECIAPAKRKAKPKPKQSALPVDGAEQRFVRPTLEQVAAYVKERGFGFDPEAFFLHYESTGWMRGKTKIKNWRMAAALWDRNDKRWGAKPSGRRQEAMSESDWERGRAQAAAPLGLFEGDL